MNYAEDRLDRRARSSSETASQQGDKVTDLLAYDLKRAHDVFNTYHSSSSSSSLSIQSLQELRRAHELAGKTLRDGGHNRQAVFHFGMAWQCCHLLKHTTINHFSENSNDAINNILKEDEEAEHEWRSVGDYAQMCELSGFSEVGVLALLFYRAGGNCNGYAPSLLMPSTTADIEDDDESAGCGCGMADCGASPCCVAFPTHSQVMSDIMDALDAFSSISIDGTFPTASDVLAQLAKMDRRKDVTIDPVADMHTFMCTHQAIRDMPSILQFWDVTPNNLQCEYRALPNVILLLLLKLLYSSPVAGSFLQLASISMPYLAGMLPPASAEGKRLARQYKSHNAYYVFIRALILGERVKKHRKGSHVPVWNVVFGLLEKEQKIEDENEEYFFLVSFSYDKSNENLSKSSCEIANTHCHSRVKS